MSIVRESIQACGEPDKAIVREIALATRREAESVLRRQYQELLARQESWPGVWSTSLRENRYTIDNNDGDFFEGVISEGGESK